MRGNNSANKASGQRTHPFVNGKWGSPDGFSGEGITLAQALWDRQSAVGQIVQHPQGRYAEFEIGLHHRDLCILPVKGDGNCLFRYGGNGRVWERMGRERVEEQEKEGKEKHEYSR